MYQLRWTMLILVLCLPLGLLAFGVPIPGLTITDYSNPMPVPEGDQEIAWLNTTTSAASWERFVAGAKRAELLVPGLKVDDRHAFREQTTSMPEITLQMADSPARLRVRWYKLNGEQGESYWAEKLAARVPAPLAIVGGGSSDRARDMGTSLSQIATWQGTPPLFLITNATAEKVRPASALSAAPGEERSGEVDLLKLYPERTFRFCFNNKQMADSILDFVWNSPALRPYSGKQLARQALLSSVAVPTLAPSRASVFYVDWNDDPYSGDLIRRFLEGLPRVVEQHHFGDGVPLSPLVKGWRVPFSVGGFYTPNRSERIAATEICEALELQPIHRSLLIVPTVTAPARRLLRTLAEIDPNIGNRLIAVNGDGMGVNAVLRDGEFAWPVNVLPIPLILFTHNNPLAWDDPDSVSDLAKEYRLEPPNGTEEVLHNAELVRTIATAAFGITPQGSPNMLSTSSDQLRERFRQLSPAFFDPDGNRVVGSGEHLLLLRPKLKTLEVWRSANRRDWEFVKSAPLLTSERAMTP